MTDLDARAVAILRANDRGGYTVPTARLYPFQWNWDSAFAALGFATFDEPRAWRELQLLVEGQAPDGMLPHIVFRHDDADYFPGPAVWGTGRTPPASGISQPPVAASVVRWLLEAGDAAVAEPAARALYPALLAWHRWFHSARDPDAKGYVATTHPWESGRDNALDWDGAMAAVDPSGIAPYQRRDTGHVDPSMRPTQAEYDRYLKLVEFGRETGWNPERIYRESPLLVADPGLTFMLLRADRDLLAVARSLGLDEGQSELRAWIERANAGVRELWSDDVGGFVALDLRSGALAPALSSVAFLAWYAGLPPGPWAAPLRTNLERMLGAVSFGVPSLDPAHDAFDQRRYWRGPVWAVVNFMIGCGLAEQGEQVLAERVRSDTSRLIETAGFFEYFDPLTGAGCGGADFTWTAAMWLAWASPNRREVR
ncbi:MAG: hypothetical protein AAFX81_20150 [Pseudomonadota bacterium]